MKVHRIHISSWTASFRYPNMISGFQPTLPVPPLSTIFGLISAAMGKYYTPNKLDIGFVFLSKCKTVDLETIYQMNRTLRNIKSNVVKREILFDNNLWIYTQNYEIAEAFNKPYYPLLLGRSGDLATVDSIAEIDVEPKEQLSRLKGTIIPFIKYRIAGPIQALPIYFSNTIPRRNIGTKPYYLLDSNYRQNQPISAKGFVDKELDFEVYWQE
ncbi:MAG: type I-B CRISPR-associated protein Cas5b [Promethearchaeota archaeon]